MIKGMRVTMKRRQFWILILLAWSSIPVVNAQGFLHADGKRIVNGDGENVILRGDRHRELDDTGRLYDGISRCGRDPA
ncbi:MAG: hypothetical protein V2B15_20040 [Bacteroidota bacterium]